VNGPGNAGTGQESGSCLMGSIQGAFPPYGELAGYMSCKYAMRLMHFAVHPMGVVPEWVRDLRWNSKGGSQSQP
jgi:hypothetical protein